jgi:hypothetical protein
MAQQLFFFTEVSAYLGTMMCQKRADATVILAIHDLDAKMAKVEASLTLFAHGDQELGMMKHHASLSTEGLHELFIIPREDTMRLIDGLHHAYKVAVLRIHARTQHCLHWTIMDGAPLILHQLSPVIF